MAPFKFPNQMRYLFGLVLCGCVSHTGADIDAGNDAGSPQMMADGGQMASDGGNVGSDAGSMPEDAGTMGFDGGSGSVCPSHALFCEDFESGLDNALWAINGNASTFTVDTSVSAAHGQKSLHAAYGLTYGHTGTPSIQLKVPIAAPDDRVYVRTYFRFDKLNLPGAHPFFISISDAALTEVGFGSIFNDFALMAWAPGGLDNPRPWYEGNGWHPGQEDGDNTPNTEHDLQAKSWFCVELMLFGDHQGAGDTSHPAEEAKVWINGVEITDMNMSDSIWRQELGHNPPEHWSPVYNHAIWKFGVESFGPQQAALDIWFDAIAISNQRIGCGLQ